MRGNSPLTRFWVSFSTTDSAENGTSDQNPNSTESDFDPPPKLGEEATDPQLDETEDPTDEDSPSGEKKSSQDTPRWVFFTLLGILIAAILATVAWTVELPYYAYSSGPVGDAIEAIEVEDESLMIYPPSGELLMLTVSLQRVNIYEAVRAELDSAIDLVRVEAIRSPDETDEEFRNRGLQAMDTSKETAIMVAFAELDLELTSEGVQIATILGDSPSAEVLRVGDVITGVGSEPVVAVEQLLSATAELSPGDTLTLTIERAGEPQDFDVELYADPEDNERARIGIGGIPYIANLPVDIDSANIGGPSAGLMYTLAIIDKLEPEELTGGQIIAGTGTVNGDGSVGAIGGVRQKAVAAELAGAKYLLVPEANYSEATTAPVDDLEIVAVGSVDDALEFLSGLS